MIGEVTCERTLLNRVTAWALIFLTVIAVMVLAYPSPLIP
jgi:hypothetical protein